MKNTSNYSIGANFPKKANQNKAYLEKQMKDTEAMFDDILSYTKDF